MTLLSRNSKMKLSSTKKIKVVNWTLPAKMTCPNAGVCAVGCYATQGTFQFSNVKKKHLANLAASKSPGFVRMMVQEIEGLLQKHSSHHVKIRIHDSGDFYSLEYLNKWVEIMNYFSLNKKISFYSYTKSVKMIKFHQSLPKNFHVIFSYGGKQDHLIDSNIDFHSRVFETKRDLLNSGYTDGSNNDLVAGLGIFKKIGLVYHGAKSFEKTMFKKVG